MTKKDCSSCYYNHSCDSSQVCEDYFPVDNLLTDAAIDEMIENNRISFRDEWFNYIDAFYN